MVTCQSPRMVTLTFLSYSPVTRVLLYRLKQIEVVHQSVSLFLSVFSKCTYRIKTRSSMHNYGIFIVSLDLLYLYFHKKGVILVLMIKPNFRNVLSLELFCKFITCNTSIGKKEKSTRNVSTKVFFKWVT